MPVQEYLTVDLHEDNGIHFSSAPNIVTIDVLKNMILLLMRERMRESVLTRFIVMMIITEKFTNLNVCLPQ